MRQDAFRYILNGSFAEEDTNGNTNGIAQRYKIILESKPFESVADANQL